jgi:hypothetical protein
MLAIIAVFGILIVFACSYGMASPSGLLELVGRFANRQGYAFAIAVRVVLGAVSILAAPASLMPVLLYVVGAIALAAAAVLLLIGLPGYRRIMEWVAGFAPSMLRVGLVFGLVFGAALIWVTDII